MGTPLATCGGVGVNTTFSYQACAAGTHIFTLQWDPDQDETTFTVELEEDEIFEDSHIYQEPGKYSLIYDLEAIFNLGGSFNTTLTDDQRWNWNMTTTTGEEECEELVESTCVSTPVITCNGVGETSTFEYTACGSNWHTFELQWDKGDTQYVTVTYLLEGDVWTREHSYVEEGLKMASFEVEGKVGPNSQTYSLDVEWLVSDDECSEPSMAPSMPPSGGTSNHSLEIPSTCSLLLILLLKNFV